jgi:hypothetical protein
VPLDDFTRSLGKYIDNGTGGMDLFLPFFADALLAVRFHLSSDRAFADLQQITKLWHTSATSFDSKTHNCDKDVRAVDGGCKFWATYILQDPCWNRKKQWLYENNQEIAEFDMFHLYRRQPLLCGSLALQGLMHNIKAGTTIAGHSALFTATLYLHHALKLTGNLLCPWPEVENALGLHTSEKVFGMKEPANLMECDKRLMLAVGGSVNNIPRPGGRKHVRKMTFQKNNIRLLLPSLPDLDQLLESHGSGDVDRDTQWWETVLNARLSEGITKVAHQPKRKGKSKKKKGKSKKNEESSRLSDKDLDRAVDEHLPRIIEQLEFDYIGLYTHCKLMYPILMRR